MNVANLVPNVALRRNLMPESLTGASDVGKKLIQENFKMDEALETKLLKTVGILDETKSKVIRVCLRLALPMLEENPLLVRLIDD